MCLGLHPLLHHARKECKERRPRLPVNRPPSAGYDPGTTPSRAKAAPFSLAQTRDYETHRPIKMTFRQIDGSGTGTRHSNESVAGQEKSLRGSGWPPKKGVAQIRVSTKGLSPQAGGKERGPAIVKTHQDAT